MPAHSTSTTMPHPGDCKRFPGTSTMPKWEMTEDIDITGIGGRYPECDSIEEFKKNLFSKVDMVTDYGRRWEAGLFGLPNRMGTLKDITKFDAIFFGVHARQADSMDPQLRMLLETTYEAITDAGYEASMLRGQDIGVFIGCSLSESEDAFTSDPEKITGYALPGCCRSMFANRVSFSFDFTGPSFCLDTACSSSMTAFQQAILSMRTNQCSGAIVGGMNIIFKPTNSLQFHKLNMLSLDGKCKAFDATVNGYVRSETVSAIFLQKASASRRVYATVVHSKCNTDGSKADGITYPSSMMQTRLLDDVLSEAQVDPQDIAYVEAHGTGTKAGDPEEIMTITNILCKGRQGPLLIGSVKSNMGHAESASGLCFSSLNIGLGTLPTRRQLAYENPVPALNTYILGNTVT